MHDMLWHEGDASLHPQALRFSSSLADDFFLAQDDVAASRAHARMLFSIGILTDGECKKIDAGLEQIAREWQSQAPDVSRYEDVHSAIESRLTEIIGDIAGKLHTGRSRNDQVATAMRLWVRRSCATLTVELAALQRILVSLAREHVDTVMPGYTHLQRAQPISLAFHLLAYVEMTERDKQRLRCVDAMADQCPLGSGALAGSTLPLDRRQVAEALGFSGPTQNALDAVSDRDFVLDFLHASTTGMLHLSRLAEEIILWSSGEWNFIKLSDAWTTGSSLMPQKRNPDLAELTRGRSGTMLGHYVAMAATLKALPLSYNRDLQEDKRNVSAAFVIWHDCIRAIAALIATMTVHTQRFAAELDRDECLVTDLADALVRRGVPFRQAHHQISKLLARARDTDQKLAQLSVEEMQTVCPSIRKEDLDVLSIRNALARKQTIGSPHPEFVRERIAHWTTHLTVSK
jgi:argininosuccinate lyase